MTTGAASGAARVSVVVPAHDAASTIGRALRSALGQTRPPDEVVVVDDGSTDGTAAAVAELGDLVRLVRQAQSGPSAARNAGVAASSGEWLAFLDADDTWHPRKLELQLLHASGSAMVATDWVRDPTWTDVPDRVPTTRISTHDILLMNRFQTSTVLLRRDAFDSVGGFDPSLDGVEDWDMWLRCSRHGAVVKLDWPLVQYTDVSSGYSKASARVYRTGAAMLERELGPVRGPRERAVLAFHHLRWAMAFWLLHDRDQARACLATCRADGLTGAVPEAAVRYLAPYLGWRVDRRFRRLVAPVRRNGGDRTRR